MDEASNLLGCDALSLGIWLQGFKTTMLSLKCWQPYTLGPNFDIPEEIKSGITMLSNVAYLFC